ncbi:CMGC family protein kinase [Trichomonas vaginalis G3]|uniref:dual-specificity kinase n=1 Tax=Trichomonas vaginalis (strain ATCC PRA-98 / G3) TaxID=412133 RepID=A2FED4_TRIV3|nr:protein kinase protein [Trichomonas vaginalis G3]EAX96721.1 CMGC family protein kinase [Trichomonas vaginalis G3]KAI5521686.1 protein kinase protein [Trichomonas vaginalis G3]|eukprot:XP_001309651.1 CMGC family protein kinase [Trichomonas vaginalis G3]
MEGPPSPRQFKPHVPLIPLPPESAPRAIRRVPVLRSSDKILKSGRFLPTLPILPEQGSRNPRFKQRNAIKTEIPKSTRVSINRLPNLPITPEEAKKSYNDILSSFEQFEINQFPEIYYIGNVNNKFTQNFDDKNHSYKVIIGDHLAYRYEILLVLGSGAFGKVVKCFDHKNKVLVAVKIIISTQQMAEQSKIEASSLAKVNKIDTNNIVRAYDFFVFRNHPCITYELLGSSLRGQRVITPSIKPICYQIFSALASLKKCGIIHCDIKPDNLLFIQDTTKVKLIDFGTSCISGRQIFTYIQSRFYRAPEVILGCGYGHEIDVWSAALVCIELITGKPLFPGSNEVDMLRLFIEFMKYPPIELLRKSSRVLNFFDDKYRPLFHVKPGTKNILDFVGSIDPQFYDLLTHCLRWLPSERFTPEQALAHPYFSDIVPQSNLPDLRASYKGETLG